MEPLKRLWPHLMMVVMVVSALGQHSEGNCNVESSVRINEPGATLPLLAYVCRSTNLTLAFIFDNVNQYEEWHAVSLNSTGATHSVVRSGEKTWMPIDLPRLIPEGWNTFTVALDKQGVTVTLTQGQDQLTLFMLPLPRCVTSVLAKGTVTSCPTSSPEWEVAAGRQVEVFLQPGSSRHDQWMEVSGESGGAAAPYISFPSPLGTMYPVPANTILRIASSLRGDHAILKVFKDGDGGGEELVKERVPITSIMTMLVSNGDDDDDGGDGSNIHLRLLLSPPPMNDNTPIVATSGARDFILTTFVVFIVLAVVVSLAVYCWLSRAKEDKQMIISNSIIPETLTSLSRQRNFEGRLSYITTNGMQELKIYLPPDKTSVQLLDKLHGIDTSRVDLLLVHVPEASQLCPYVENLYSLPDSLKVKLEVAAFTKEDITRVCRLVKKLQPQNGFSVIDFREESSSSSSRDGQVLREEEWINLLTCLHGEEVKVKGKVWLPIGALAEERRQLLPISFTYACRSDDCSLMM